MAGTIALYISSLRKGGAERVIANLADYFYQKNYRVLLVTTRKEEEEYELPEGILRRISEPSPEELSGGRIANFAARFGKLRNIWKEEKPDVILSFIGKNNMMAVLTSAGLKIPVAVSVRGDPNEEYYSKWMRFMAGWLFRFAKGVVLQTERSRFFFPKEVRKKAVILKNPVNPAFFRERFNGEREKAIVAVGRVDENKNHEMLIRAFAQIALQFPEYKLIIYGEGEKREELRGLVGELGMEERILLPGSAGQVADVIYRAYAFVLPSNTEGMPNTLIEAMLLGLTVIATDCPCGGPAELIVHGVNGLLTPVGDVEKMRDNLEFVLSSPEAAERMGRNAAKLSEVYESGAVCEEWRKYLEMLMV